MANTLGSVPTKVLILFVLSLALCFYDLPVWAAQLRHLDVQVTFLLAFSLVGLGLYLKRQALSIIFETSRIGFMRGIMLLVASALMYAYGSYTTSMVWLHYVSLLFFVAGYVVLRVGTSVIRTLAPLLPILAFAFVPSSSFDALTPSTLVLLLALVYGVAFLVFVGPRLRQFAFPMLLIDVALGVWVASAHGGPSYAPLLVPAPLLLLAIPRVRRFAELPRSSVGYSCFSHTPEPNGFCSFCGKKVAPATTPENFGGWGMLAACGVVVLLLVSSVPMLSISAGAYDGVYTARGPSLTPLPITPKGWQVNASVLHSWNASSGAYETVNVYVPLVNPEVKNYTVYYSMAPTGNVPSAPAGAIPEWKWISSTLVPLAGFQGRLATYVNGSRTMLSYGGSRTMNFLSGYQFLTESVTVGFVREFKNANVGADTNQFLTDLQAIWAPLLTADSFYSGWGSFVSGTETQVVALEPLIGAIGSLSVIGWAAYRVIRSEESLDRFYTAAVLTKERTWLVLVQLLRMPRKPRTGFELAGPGGQASQAEVNEALKSLEKEGLVKQKLVPSGDGYRLAWGPRV